MNFFIESKLNVAELTIVEMFSTSSFLAGDTVSAIMDETLSDYIENIHSLTFSMTLSMPSKTLELTISTIRQLCQR